MRKFYRCDKCFMGASGTDAEGKFCLSCGVGRLRIVADDSETDRLKVGESSGELAPPTSSEVSKIFAEEVSWQLMECGECGYRERMSLSIEKILCPKPRCDGWMVSCDPNAGKRVPPL